MLGKVGRGLYKAAKAVVYNAPRAIKNTITGTWAYHHNPAAKEYYDKMHTGKLNNHLSSEPLNFPSVTSSEEYDEELSPSAKALRNIRAHQQQFKPSTISNSGASEYSTNSFFASRGSFSNIPNGTRRRKMSWEPVHPRGGKRRSKRTRRNR
jgi:hypothetical protein